MKGVSVHSILGVGEVSLLAYLEPWERFCMFVKEMRENDVSQYIHLHLLYECKHDNVNLETKKKFEAMNSSGILYMKLSLLYEFC